MKLMISAHDELSTMDSDADSGGASGEEADTDNDFDDEFPDATNSSQDGSYATQPKSPFGLILQKSTLAKSMKTIYEDLSNTGIVQVRINHWVLVSFCLPHKAHQTHNTGLVIEPETIDKCLQRLRPYHGMLLMVNPNDLLESMPLDGSPALLRLIKLYSPLKSLQTIAIEADLPLSQVFQLVGHLVYWAKATVIYPLCESNVYVVAPGAPVHANSPLVAEFAKDFPELCLLQVLAEFSLPAPLWYHVRVGAACARGASCLARVAAWLLLRRLLLQLHTYVQFRMSNWGIANDGKEYYCEKHNTYNNLSSDSLNYTQNNGSIPSRRNSITFLDNEQAYPTENNLNQTNFSHTKPIIIDSDVNRGFLEMDVVSYTTNEADSANHSLEGSDDAVDGFINASHLRDSDLNDQGDFVPDASQSKNIQIENRGDKETNELSIDSGYANEQNKHQITTIFERKKREDDFDNINSVAENLVEMNIDKSPSLESVCSNRIENFKSNISTSDSKTIVDNYSITSISENNQDTERRSEISFNMKNQNDMSFQPPTIVSNISMQNSCDAVDNSSARLSGLAPNEQMSEEMLLQEFTEEERTAIFRIPAAHNPEDLAMMSQLHKKGYFRGAQHLEEIMFLENLTRSQLLQLLDKFRDVLITFETEDPAIALLYTNH